MIPKVNNISFKQVFLAQDLHNKKEDLSKFKKSASILNLMSNVDIFYSLTTKNNLLIEVEKTNNPSAALDYCLQTDNQELLNNYKESYMFGQYLKSLCRDLLPRNSYKHITTNTIDKMDENDILQETIIAVATHNATRNMDLN